MSLAAKAPVGSIVKAIAADSAKLSMRFFMYLGPSFLKFCFFPDSAAKSHSSSPCNRFRVVMHSVFFLANVCVTCTYNSIPVPSEKQSHFSPIFSSKNYAFLPQLRVRCCAQQSSPPEPINRSDGSFTVIKLSLPAGNGAQSRRRDVLCSEVILLHKEILRTDLTEAVLDADALHRKPASLRSSGW